VLGIITDSVGVFTKTAEYTAPGNYSAQLTRASDSTYNAYSDTKTFVVTATKKDLTVSWTVTVS
jgi:hypothetical protein